MPGAFFLREDRKTAGFHFWGDYFSEFLTEVKRRYLTFSKTFVTHDGGEVENVWTFPAVFLSLYWEKFSQIEEIPYPEEILKLVDNTSELRIVRRGLDPSLCVGSWIGKTDYQKEGTARMVRQNRLALFWEQGLGKSYTVITALNHHFASGRVDRLLVLTTSDAVWNFRKELIKFGLFAKEDEIYVASVTSREPFQPHHKVVLSTFNTYRMLAEDLYREKNKLPRVTITTDPKTGKETRKQNNKFRNLPFPLASWGTSRCLVVDESQAIRNSDSSQSRTVLLSRKYFEYRYLLSGTPAPKDATNLWPQVMMLDESAILPDEYVFRESIADIGNRWSPVAVNFVYAHKEKAFLKSIQHLVSREFVKDNLDLPPLKLRPVYCKMTPEQDSLYKDFSKHVFSVLKEEKGEITSKDVADKFPYLSLALDNPSILLKKFDPESNPALYSQLKKWKMDYHGKMEVCDALVEKYISEQGEKLILWSTHPVTIEYLADRYKKYKPLVVHGQALVGEKGISRDEVKFNLVEEFKFSKDRNLLIGNPSMLARSLNITQCRRAIYFDNTWDWEIFDQSLKRIFRYGSQGTVLVDLLIFQDSLNERQFQVLTHRDQFNKSLFVERTHLALEEWRSILTGKNLEGEVIPPSSEYNLS